VVVAIPKRRIESGTQIAIVFVLLSLSAIVF